MSLFDPALAVSPAERPDYLPPPPRSATLALGAGWLRVGFLAGLLLTPPAILFLGQRSGDDLRALVAHGRSATGQIVLRG
jgi:hypothetical protein